jgi:predicted secreted protein
MRRSIGLLAAALALAPTAQAADGADVPSVPVVTVTASATASVANDRLQAWIRAEAENASPAAAAKDVNARIAKAIERAKAIASVTVQTSGYTTQQVAERGRPTRWRVAQTISIEGNDFAAIASLVTQLQDEDGLLLSGLTFTVSQTKRHEMEDALTQQALASWRVRAQNAARGLGLNGWRPGRVVVSTNDFARPQPMMRAGIAAAGAPAPPVPLEAGVTDVTVTVTGDAVADAAPAAPR